MGKNCRRTIGLVGTGVIGAGWAVRVLARGHGVVAWDPGEGAETRLRSAIERAWPSAADLGLFPDADPDSLRWASSAQEVAASADFVQESAPEVESLKRSLLAEVDTAADPSTPIASSSSGLLPSKLAEPLAHPERLVIGHPFNPVYLLPLVEVVRGEATSDETLAAALEHYDDLVMHPLVVREEIEGYLSDRLQEALWRENLHLVNDGVATTAELDDAIVYGPGLRWAAMGTNLTFHLAGGDGGMRHMLRQFGPALALPWTRLEAPELTPELIEAMAAGCEDQAGPRSIAELERLRDDSLLAVMRALRPSGLGAGRLMAEREARILVAANAQHRQWSPSSKVAAPLDLYSTVVMPDWVDYNGHMTEWAFLTAFGWAADALFRYIGIDEAYRAAGHSYYTVETHLTHLREASVGEPLRITTQVLGSDAKRLHIFHAMYRCDGHRHDHDEHQHHEHDHSERQHDEMLCVGEQMLVHVDTAAGRSAPLAEVPAAAVAAITAAHASMPTPPQAGSRMALLPT